MSPDQQCTAVIIVFAILGYVFNYITRNKAEAGKSDGWMRVVSFFFRWFLFMVFWWIAMINGWLSF